MKKVIGIPRGLFYYKYIYLWDKFFKEIGMEVIVSDPTNKQILDDGVKTCVDEACLPVKVFHGHVINLKDRVDYIFIPRLTSVSKMEYICPEFGGLPDMIRHTIKKLPPIIDTEINMRKSDKGAIRAALETGTLLGISKGAAKAAFVNALNGYKSIRSKEMQGELPTFEENIRVASVVNESAETGNGTFSEAIRTASAVCDKASSSTYSENAVVTASNESAETGNGTFSGNIQAVSSKVVLNTYLEGTVASKATSNTHSEGTTAVAAKTSEGNRAVPVTAKTEENSMSSSEKNEASGDEIAIPANSNKEITAKSNSPITRITEELYSSISADKPRIALIGHPYVVYDKYMSMDIVNKLQKFNIDVVTIEMVRQDDINKQALKLHKPMFWNYGRNAYGSSLHLASAGNIKGMIFLTSFGCGIDSFVNDFIERQLRRENEIPFINITIDEHSGEAGFNTRLEAFVDMLRWRRTYEDNIPALG